MQTWRLKALQGPDAVPSSSVVSGGQDMIKGEATQPDQQCMITGHWGCPAWRGQEAPVCSLCQVALGQQLQRTPTALPGRRRGFIGWKSSDLKNNMYQWFCLFPESVSSLGIHYHVFALLTAVLVNTCKWSRNNVK